MECNFGGMLIRFVRRFNQPDVFADLHDMREALEQENRRREYRRLHEEHERRDERAYAEWPRIRAEGEAIVEEWGRIIEERRLLFDYDAQHEEGWQEEAQAQNDANAEEERYWAEVWEERDAVEEERVMHIQRAAEEANALVDPNNPNNFNAVVVADDQPVVDDEPAPEFRIVQKRVYQVTNFPERGDYFCVGMWSILRARFALFGEYFTPSTFGMREWYGHRVINTPERLPVSQITNPIRTGWFGLPVNIKDGGYLTDMGYTSYRDVQVSQVVLDFLMERSIGVRACRENNSSLLDGAKSHFTRVLPQLSDDVLEESVLYFIQMREYKEYIAMRTIASSTNQPRSFDQVRF